MAKFRTGFKEPVDWDEVSRDITLLEKKVLDALVSAERWLRSGENESTLVVDANLGAKRVVAALREIGFHIPEHLNQKLAEYNEQRALPEKTLVS